MEIDLVVFMIIDFDCEILGPNTVENKQVLNAI